MKKMLNKIISITMVLSMLGMIFLPTMARATEEATEAADTTEAAEATENEVVLTQVKDISEIKLNTKVVFSGKLYKMSLPTLSQILNKQSLTNLNSKAEYKDQKAVVMSLLRKSQGMILVGFIPEGKEVPVVGYIKMDEETTISNTSEKYISISLDLANIKNGAAIVVDGEKYDISAGVSNIEIANGAVNIDGNVVLIRESVKLVNFDGDLNLDIGNKTAGGSAAVQISDKISVDGDASIAIVDNGVSVSGDANVNGKEIGNGEAKITYSAETEDPINVEISKASVFGNDFTTLANSLLQKVFEIIKSLLARILG